MTCSRIPGPHSRHHYRPVFVAVVAIALTTTGCHVKQPYEPTPATDAAKPKLS